MPYKKAGSCLESQPHLLQSPESWQLYGATATSPAESRVQMPEQHVYVNIEIIINIINKYELNQLNISCVHFNCENDKAVILTCLMTCFSLEQNQKVIIYIEK